MSSLTFATSTNKDDLFGGFKGLNLEEHKSAGRLQEALTSQPKLVSMNSASSGSTGLFGLNKQPLQTEVKTLNAKKLDVNFDSEDFFNSF